MKEPEKGIKRYILFSPTWAMWRRQWDEANTFAECYGLLHEIPFLLEAYGNLCGVAPILFLADMIDPAKTELCRQSPDRCMSGPPTFSGVCPHILLERKAAETFLFILQNRNILERAPQNIIDTIIALFLSEPRRHLYRHLNEKTVDDATLLFTFRHRSRPQAPAASP